MSQSLNKNIDDAIRPIIGSNYFDSYDIIHNYCMLDISYPLNVFMSFGERRTSLCTKIPTNDHVICHQNDEASPIVHHPILLGESTIRNLTNVTSSPVRNVPTR